MTMKIAIIGTRGIPNRYGGFEQFAQQLSAGLVARGHDVCVYTPHHHPYRDASWMGVRLLRQRDPQWLGTAGQFLYDLACIRDTRKQDFDIILQLGYTSSSVWGWLLPRNAVVTTNMDGWEWKRSKYPAPVRRFLRRAESLAVRYSDHLIADAPAIQAYLQEKYGRAAHYIPYGAHQMEINNEEPIRRLGLEPYRYDLLIARMEPENQVEMILEGAQASPGNDLLVVGSTDTKYGRRWKKCFSRERGIRCLGPVYDADLLDRLRAYSRLYFHGHSVGGTNPSLLEAMGAGALVAAHDNAFNRYVLQEGGWYFSDAADIARLRRQTDRLSEENRQRVLLSRERIAAEYNWEGIIDAYEAHFRQILPVQPCTVQAAADLRPQLSRSSISSSSR